MNVRNIARRLGGAAKNGVLWGATWFTLAFATILGLRTVGVVVPPEIGVLDAIGMAIRVGIVGGLAGGAFAGVVSVLYRGRRLSEISAVRFGVGGAVVAELFVLAFFAIGPLLSGGAFPALGDILSDLVVAAVFGGVAAGASIWLAQRAEPRSVGGPDRHHGLSAAPPLPEMRETAQRAAVPVRHEDRPDAPGNAR